MIVFYIGFSVCAFLLAAWNILAVVVCFNQAKQFNGPTFGEQIIRDNIGRSILLSAFLGFVWAFLSVGFVVLALGERS